MYPWGDKRRFNSYARYIKERFGSRVQKLSIDAGFTCPNRDGSVGTGGCTYCNNDSFNPSYCSQSKSISQQLAEGIDFYAYRYRRVTKFLAYFQAYSNTYSSLEKLKELYNEALSHPNIAGIVIGTRPDCVDEKKLDYFASIAKEHYLSVEYGVESCLNNTLEKINRGHTYEQSVWAIEQTAKRGINVGAHFIIGLPGESADGFIDQVQTINRLPLSSIKFHQLQIVKNTQMAKEYSEKPEEFHFFSADEYLNLMVEVIEQLDPDIVIERITGEASHKMLIAPSWGNYRTDQLLIKFEELLEEKNSWQGKLFVK